MTRKKLGRLSKLSQLSGIPQNKEPTAAIVEDLPREASDVAPSAPSPPSKVEAKVEKKDQVTSKDEKLVTVNIKITKAQKDWLAQAASQVRDNNLEPVPPSERVYPQHLIGVAIELLQSSEVDWSQVKNVKDLQEQLNL